MRIKFILPIVFSALLGACADTGCGINAGGSSSCMTASTATAIQYTNAPVQAAPARVVPVRIDSNFNMYERTKIFRAVNEWNHVLNGQVRLDISPESIDTSTAMGVGAPRAEGWTIAKGDSRDPMLANPAMKRTLALTMGTKRAIILVVADRLGNRDLGGIMMHEFGHALGAGHDSGSALMHPYYTGDKQRCIDKAAVQAVAIAQQLPIEGLNWCGGEATNVAELAPARRR